VRGGRGAGTSYSGDSGAAPLAVWQSAGAGRISLGLRETDQPEESGSFDAGERLKRPPEKEVHPCREIGLRTPGL
jgi:hypothetical protein